MHSRTSFPRALGWALAALSLNLTCFVATHARAADASNDDLAAKVQQVFIIKCGDCHGAQATKTHKFGGIEDLAKVKSNKKLAVPGNIEDSQVWTTVDDGDMPPKDDAKSKPLTDDEKATIKAWVAAGCPVGNTTPETGLAKAGVKVGGPDATARAANPVPAVGQGSNTTPFVRRLCRWVGKFHPLVAHFPIALLMGAAVAEGLWFVTRRDWFTGATRFTTMFGTLGALGAATLGWFDAYFHSSGHLLTQHRWLGTIAALYAILVATLCERGLRRAGRAPDAVPGRLRWTGPSRLAFQLALLVGVALIGAAAHLGGGLVYGEDYFQF